MGSPRWLLAFILALCTSITLSSKENSLYGDILKSKSEKQLSEISRGMQISNPKASVKFSENPRLNIVFSKTISPKNNSNSLSKLVDVNDDYYNDDYEADYSYDENNITEAGKTQAAGSDAFKKNLGKMSTVVSQSLTSSTLNTSITSKPKTTAAVKKIGKLKPIKEDKKSIIDSDPEQNLNDDIIDEEDEKYSDEEDDDEYNDDITDEEEIVFNENIPCPTDCICARNTNSYLVATCSILDSDKQKFGSDITDLVVVDIGPKYPILLGPEFFVKIGLKHVSSIKVSNCTIENLHQAAFSGLDDLYSVNLTNVGLSIIDPDTFANNKKLRMLTISGNDLSIMSNLNYILKSSSVEELDLSRNNLIQINPYAFSALSNIVYINLASNNLKTVPETLFDSVETIEELDLSFNMLKNLPPSIFNRTALSILHLKYNQITVDLRFGTRDLQHLDLSFCSIKTVNHHMFDKMEGLTNLNLKGNGITNIQTDSFLTLKSLRYIDLSINELDQVSSLIFYKNSELDVIRLNDNPRLSQLPTDGFESSTGVFPVYLLDVSNCAVGALGHKMFSTMPNLATLKLAWNNINNLDSDTFESLYKLTELDLSNNLIVRLDEFMFKNNSEIAKLNLAGNPIRKLTADLFLPLKKLNELDVSECELHSLIIESPSRGGLKYRFYDTLRTFNASANQIRRISVNWIKHFSNLRTLDISNNPLKCNDEFQDFINYVSVNSKLVPSRIPTLASMQSSSFTEFQSHIGWSDLARKVCRHFHFTSTPSANAVSKGDIISHELIIEDIQKNLDGYSKNLVDLISKRKLPKIQKSLKDSNKIETNDEEPKPTYHHEESPKKIIPRKEDRFYDVNDGSDDENKSDYDYDEETDEEDVHEAFDKKKSANIDISELPKIIDGEGPIVEEVNLSKETQDKFLLNKFILNSDDEDEFQNQMEEIFIDKARIYYNGYRFLIPGAVVVIFIIVLLFVIAKFVSFTIRKRGERYRMALLASNNSIVYQKLSEEIIPPSKQLKNLKIHRYSRINQV